ncbi:unnamed protein product, partial [Brassica oleracea]
IDKREGKRTREEQEHVVIVKDLPPTCIQCLSYSLSSIFLLPTNTLYLFSSLALKQISNYICLALISHFIQAQHIEVMSCSVKRGLKMVFCFILLLLSSNFGCATARRLRFHKHHHKVASLVQDARRVLGGEETGEDVVVMDYPQPHRKPPIHNEKA